MSDKNYFNNFISTTKIYSYVVTDPINCILIEQTVKEIEMCGRKVIDIRLIPDGYEILAEEQEIREMSDDLNIIKIKGGNSSFVL